MTKETIQRSEPDLLVFISSRQDTEMNPARAVAFDTVYKYPGMRCWAFENAPESSPSKLGKSTLGTQERPTSSYGL